MGGDAHDGGRAEHVDGSTRSPISASARRAFRTVWAHLVQEDPVGPADAIFCFGSRHHRVPERAASLFAAGVAPVVLVTGGPAAPGEAAESTVFAEALVGLGVPRASIVAEPVARHTGENVELGVQALAAVAPAERLVLVSWPLAARRTAATFAGRCPEVEVACAPALRRPGWRWSPTVKRIRLALGELDRLESYASLGWIEPVPLADDVAEATQVLREELRSADDATLHRVPAPRPGPEAEQPPLLVVER